MRAASVSDYDAGARRIRLIAALLIGAGLLIGCVASAEAAGEAALSKIGFSKFTAYADALGYFDAWTTVRRLMRGEAQLHTEAPAAFFRQFTDLLRQSFVGLSLRLASPVLAGLVLRIVLSEKKAAGSGALLLCRTACITVLMAAFADAREIAAQLMRRLSDAVGVVSPVLTASAALTGAEAMAGILSPMAALCASAIEDILLSPGLTLCGAAAIVSAAGNLSERFRLKKLFDLAIGVVRRGLILLTAAFFGLTTFEGLIVSAQDSAAARAARHVVRNAVPIIGRDISGALEGLGSSVIAVRTAVGTTGVLLLMALCVQPVLRLAAASLSIRLASAIAEPIADRCTADALSQFGVVIELLLALCVASAALGIIVIGGFTGMIGLIGR